ncbi:MAG: ABC transporter permease [Myxococcales bacterium]|nr:ABC transporter permease [Myxococcales bacterium]
MNASAPELGWLSLLAAIALIAVPLGASSRLRLGLGRSIAVATARMVVQLALAGLYLRYLFAWNLPWLNLGWLLLMITAAALSACRNSELAWRTMLGPTFVATAVPALLVVTYVNAVVLRLDQVFEARYLVVIGGMLLGNTMSGNIIALTHFFHSAKADAGGYHFRLACGATRTEALRPLYREATRRAMRPFLATMMTLGIVSLPGMMTGQMLAGASPVDAIKYQMVIMFAIFTVLTTGVVLSLRLGSAVGFDRRGRVRGSIFEA